MAYDLREAIGNHVKELSKEYADADRTIAHARFEIENLRDPIFNKTNSGLARRIGILVDYATKDGAAQNWGDLAAYYGAINDLQARQAEIKGEVARLSGELATIRSLQANP